MRGADVTTKIMIFVSVNKTLASMEEKSVKKKPSNIALPGFPLPLMQGAQGFK